MEHLEKEECCSPFGVQTAEAPPNSVKKPHINIISWLFFCWIDALFWFGCWSPFDNRKIVNYPDAVDSEELLAMFNRYWENGPLSSQSLPMALFRCLWKRIVLNAVLVSAEKGLLIGECVLLGYFTEYFGIAHPSYEETRCAYLYALGIVLVSFSMATFYAHGSLVAQKTGMMAHVTVTAAVYTKVLRAGHLNGAYATAGQVINLIGNDANKFDQAFLFLHYLWIGPAYIVVYTALVYQEIGASTFVALGFVLVLVPAQWLLGWTFNKFRHELSTAAERRVKRMTEAISVMRFIKMCALEDVFTHILHKLRQSEFHKIVKTSMIRAISFSSFTVAMAVIMFLVFTVYTGSGGVLTPKKFFTILSLTATLRVTSVHFFILAVLNLLDCRVATIRIQEYLKHPNPETHFQDMTLDDAVSHKGSTENGTYICLATHGLCASWTNKEDELTIKNITFSVNEEFPLLILVGPVASGKSTLIRCLLREIEPLSGTVEVRGTVSYAAQDPWVFSGTLRENILFGSPFDKEWYDTVIEACALDKDIAGFHEGDMTLVGDKGVSLSGGQRARVTLARAIYYKADIYLLDDPLCAVDTAVARHIFEKCVGTILKNKLVVLATNQLQFAHKASKLLAIKEGGVVAFCRPCDLPSKGIHAAHLVNARDEDQFKVHWEDESKKLQCPEHQQDRNLLSPSQRRPSIFDAITFRSSQSRQASVFETTSIYSHTSERDGSSWMSTVRAMLNSNPDVYSTKAYHTIGIMMYIRYLLYGNHWAVLLVVSATIVLGEGSLIAADIWISKWTDCSSNCSASNASVHLNIVCDLPIVQRIGWLSVITVMAVLLNVTRILMIFYVAINAARLLHNKAATSVLRAPVQFIYATPIGNIANCFSKDISMLDETLPFMLCDYLLLITRCLAVFALAISSNTYIIGPAAVFLVLILCLRWYYLRTSRQLKNLESTACDPLYSHIASTIQGLLTIKTFRKESFVTTYFHQYVDTHAKLWHLCLVGARWFGMRIDYLTCVFVAVSAFTSIQLAMAFDGNLVGLGLAYTITLTVMLQYCVRLSGDVECVMLSAERLMRYTELKREGVVECGEKRPLDWPQKGEIELNGVSFFYTPDAPLVLKSLTCHIHPREKVGVVGRTGAGKSSLGALLLELATHTGTITIDGVDISQVEKQVLRRKISYVPQQPVLFSGTLRFNLDPFVECTDVEIWKSLEQVQLKTVVQNMEGGLESLVSEGGTNFSVGQRQLLCLARALLQKNRVLVLDEVTSNVDTKTNVLIQKVIKESFSECTALIISHHLNTLMECDRLLVLDGGRIKEFEHAHTLLQNPNSLFRKMVAQLGSSVATKLHAIAREDFGRRVISPAHKAVPHCMIEITITEEDTGAESVPMIG